MSTTKLVQQIRFFLYILEFLQENRSKQNKCNILDIFMACWVCEMHGVNPKVCLLDFFTEDNKLSEELSLIPHYMIRLNVFSNKLQTDNLIK